jgi:hypothetical protein
VLARLESGKAIRTDSLLKVIHGLGLATLVLPKDSAGFALAAVGQSVDWHEVARCLSPATDRPPLVEPVLDQTTPTLFLDFDGTLHVGHGVIHQDGQLSLDTGRELFEFGSLLVEILRPYPIVEIVLTTSWLQSLPINEVISCLPPELARRVVGTTKDVRPRFSYEQSGEGRTDVIVCYAYGKRLKNWLAIDDAVFGAHKFGYEPDALVEHFLLLNPERGIGDVSAQQHIRQWLQRVDLAEQLVPESKNQSVRDIPEDEKPIFSASQLRITPPRTPEQIRRLMAEGRFAEITPRQAGYDDED